MALLLALALLAAACSSSGSDEKVTNTTKAGSGGTTTPGDTAPAKSDFNQADTSGEPQDGGSITIGVESQIASLDPAGAIQQPSDVDMALGVYDPLIAYGADGNLEPSLATEWKGSDDLKSWTIKLRKGVVFQDGTPFNADAVVKQFTRLKDPKTNCTCAPALEPVATFEAPDATTVKFTLSVANAFFPAFLAGNPGYIASPTATAKYGSDYARHPVGTGPFALPNFDNLTLKKNPKYWKKDDKGVQLPYLDQIVIQPIEDAQVRLSSLRSGDVDLIQTADTETIVDVVQKGDKDIKVQKVTGSSSTIIQFNTAKPPFDDVRLRRAVALGVDRTAINNVQYSGARQESYSAFPPNSPFYSKDAELPRFDPVAAKKLVDAVKKDGGPTSFEALCIPTPESRKILGLVKQQMADIGLQQTNTFLDQGALVNQIFGKDGDYEESCFRNGQIPNADGLYNGYKTKGSSNNTFYSNPKVDAALDAIRATTDPKVQTAELIKAQIQLAKDVPVIPLLFDLFGNIYNTKVSGLPVPEPNSLGAIKLTTLYLKK